MKKLAILLLPLLGLVFAGQVYAYSGSHDFDLTVTAPDGYHYATSYASKGSFPFNGQRDYDGSRVNLKGTLVITALDDFIITPVYCATLKGNLDRAGKGTLTAVRYYDLNCKRAVVDSTVFSVSSYFENSLGNLNLAAKDSAGMVYTAIGTHQFANTK